MYSKDRLVGDVAQLIVEDTAPIPTHQVLTAARGSEAGSGVYQNIVCKRWCRN
jgi:hypothetical protein